MLHFEIGLPWPGVWLLPNNFGPSLGIGTRCANRCANSLFSPSVHFPTNQGCHGCVPWHLKATNQPTYSKPVIPLHSVAFHKWPLSQYKGLIEIDTQPSQASAQSKVRVLYTCIMPYYSVELYHAQNTWIACYTGDYFSQCGRLTSNR